MTTPAPKTQSIKLSNAALSALPVGVARPDYDRAALTPGIVHIGLGNFHRAHQAWYLHRLMQKGQAMDWAIIGAGVRPGDGVMREKLLAQDCLTTLIELDPAAMSVEVTGSMIDFLPVENDNAALIASMARSEIRIVALTVTEGGYFFDSATGRVALEAAELQHDIANPATPKTAFGAIVAALRQRRDTGVGPFTVQSCDNLQGNGTITRDVVMSVARAIDQSLADWIAQEVTFPNSMVDCIVPATGETEIDLVHELGIADAAPVTHENFRQWVIEDAFCAGRPDWDKVGATFTDDVHSHEAMKLRILNAGHQVLANAGELLSCETIADCMSDPAIAALFDKVQRDEIAPFVTAVPNMDAASYIDLVRRRFSNRAIHDTTRRVAFDGSSRHAGFVLPTLRDAIAAGASIEGFALVEALWARMCLGTREDGTEIAPNDPDWGQLNAAAQAAKTRPVAWLEQLALYGDLAQDPRFAQSFETWLTMIFDRGVRATIEAYTG